MEIISHAAIKRSDKIISIGKSHSDIIKESPYGTCKKGSEMGFITSTGRFVDRIEALQIAIDNGQINPQLKTLRKTGLLSENIWVDSNYTYNKNRGYCLLK